MKTKLTALLLAAALALTLAACGMFAAGLFLLYRAIVAVTTCPWINEEGVRAGVGVYMPWEDVHFGYVHRRAQVALPGGEEIDIAPFPVQILRDEIAHTADLAVVIRPEQHTRKRIVCARLVGRVKDRLNPALVADGDIMKIDHKNPSFFCYVSLI